MELYLLFTVQELKASVNSRSGNARLDVVSKKAADLVKMSNILFLEVSGYKYHYEYLVKLTIIPYQYWGIYP